MVFLCLVALKKKKKAKPMVQRPYSSLYSLSEAVKIEDL